MSDAFLRGLERLEDAPAAVPPAGEGPDEVLVWRALATVIDPEIGLDVVTLGLVYGVEIRGGTVEVEFTLTTRGCPMQEIITRGLEEAVSLVPGVDAVVTELVWSPEWNAGMIREDAW